MRVVTWNVDRAAPNGETLGRVVAYLRGLVDVDAVALQLTSRAFALALSDALGWRRPGTLVAGSPRLVLSTDSDEPGKAQESELFGNALLSPHEVLSGFCHSLPSPQGLLPRTVLLAELMLPGARDGKHPARISVASIHLDNTSEGVRLQQAKEAVAWLRETGRPHMLCGDLNALLAGDFQPQEWDCLCRVALRRGWEPRQEEVMRFLLDEVGYVDAFNSTHMNCPQPVSQGDPVVTHQCGDGRWTFHLPPASMWIRIDYLLLSPGFPGVATGCRCDYVDGVSNHHPVTAHVSLMEPTPHHMQLCATD